LILPLAERKNENPCDGVVVLPFILQVKVPGKYPVLLMISFQGLHEWPAGH
jgi:hypothetical protein